MSQRKRRIQIAATGAKVLGHVFGTATIFAVFNLFYLSEAAFQGLLIGLGDAQMSNQLMMEVGMMAGVSACMWAIGFIAVQLFRETRRTRRTTSLATSRGTVMTETLIVLPVFLLLVFGLSQMAINSMAGLLTTLGTYQSARTLAVWAPEIGHDRIDGGQEVTKEMVDERARAAGAGVLAPVASMSALNVNACNDQITAGADGHGQSEHVITDFLNGMKTLNLGAGADVPGQLKSWSLVDAFGTRAFALRAAPKLKVAFCASHVEWDEATIVTDPDDNQRSEITVTFTYVHRNTFPLVRHIFNNGTGNVDASKLPYQGNNSVTPISRTYSMYQQISPNPEQPLRSAIDALLGSIGGMP